jgi:hypothetical protein
VYYIQYAQQKSRLSEKALFLTVCLRVFGRDQAIFSGAFGIFEVNKKAVIRPLNYCCGFNHALSLWLGDRWFFRLTCIYVPFWYCRDHIENCSHKQENNSFFDLFFIKMISLQNLIV